ncbi:hypothetical protein HY495_02450 [Candidatus Woesearchaeota archaeon]|nr:hypothetical protein [Candidatus Woesearchaeota archaeon]
MKMTITPAVFSRLHPKLNLIFLHVTQMDNQSKAEEAAHLLKEVEKVIRLTFHRETIKNKMLLAPWSVAQREFGEGARHYQTSVEHLIKDVQHGKELATRTTITNLVRYVSLKYLVPLAVDDRSKIEGDLQFDVASGKKRTGLFRSLKKGDVYYHDAARVLGAKLNYWKSPKTLPTPETKEVLVHLDILPPVSKELQKKIVSELTSLIENFCNGRVVIDQLNRAKKSVVVK